ASRSAPLHTASNSKNFTRFGTIQSSSSTTIMVSAILNGVDSKFSRSQPMAPVMRAGGGCCAICARRTNAISVTARSPSAMVMEAPSPFHQRDPAVVDVHEERRRQADGDIDQHGNGHDLLCLAGLVEHGAGEHLHEIRIADRHRQRGV